MRELTDIFYDKTEEMIEKLHSLVEDAPQEVEVTAWLSRITLDIIGLAGFGYDFKALSSENGSGSPLYKAFKALLSHKRRDYFHQSMFTLQNLFPAIGKLPISANRKMDQRMSVMREEGRKIIDSKRSDLNETSKDNKDIISLLRKASSTSFQAQV